MSAPASAGPRRLNRPIRRRVDRRDGEREITGHQRQAGEQPGAPARSARATAGRHAPTACHRAAR